MGVFFELQPDIFAKYVPQLSSDLDESVNFIDGKTITKQIPIPLYFSTDHSSQEPPKGMHGKSIPIMSDSFIKALQGAGVSNIQCFPAVIKSRRDEYVWTDYKAVKVIGMISAADLKRSEYIPIIDRPGENSIPLIGFKDLKIDKSRALGSLLFILAENPGTIIIAENVVEFLRKQKNDEEWGITIDEC
jgi:hypothetical protein